jgi:hypothetical protein
MEIDENLLQVLQPFVATQDDLLEGAVLPERVRLDPDEVRGVGDVDDREEGQAGEGVAGQRLDKIVAQVELLQLPQVLQGRNRKLESIPTNQFELKCVYKN